MRRLFLSTGRGNELPSKIDLEDQKRRFRLLWIARPLREFLATEVAGGAVLLVAAVAALVVANAGLGPSYESLWTSGLKIGAGDIAIEEDLRHWVNDGLMALFFFVVGMEIKRELVSGQLRSFRRAALPAIAALGGMIVPAAIYMVVNLGTDEFRGWGIPMATDIAFAVGLLAVFSSRVPVALKTFLLALAIVDDLGAIAVIAVFYSEDIDPVAIAAALALLAAGAVLLRRGVSSPWPFVLVGLPLWVAVHESGVHATIAGVALAALIPARLGDDAPVLRETTPSLLARLEHNIHPFTSLVVVPLFAFANAGVRFSGDELASAAESRVAIGIFAGLVLGKTAGISLFSWLAIKSGLGHLHPSLSFLNLVSAAAVAGIGFTVSLFIGELAFRNPETVDQAKIGILVASVVAGILGSVLLILVGRGSRSDSAPVSETRAEILPEA